MKKNIAHQSYSLLIIASLTLSSCTHRKNIDKQNLYIAPEPIELITHAENPPPITIWIHGTVFFKKPPLFERYHKNPTLILASLLPERGRFRRIANTIVQHDPEHFSLEEFYIFCWSGHFSIRERKAAAEKLHAEIVALTKHYEEKYGQYPTIRIIAHSHGGNLALHMAKIKTATSPLTVKSLILLACPVQEKTMHLIDTPMFQRIYSLYSSFDLIQVLAPQLRRSDLTKKTGKKGYKIPTFSSRLFPQHPHVIQAKIKVNNFPITHTRFATTEFTEILPQILHKLDSWDAADHKQHMLHKYKLLCIYKKKERKKLLKNKHR